MKFTGSISGGFEFDTGGTMRGTPQMHDFYRHLREPISNLSTFVDEETPVACGCLHELRIAKAYGTRKAMDAALRFDLRPSLKTVAELCDTGTRICNPLCAHRGEDLFADPLGSTLEKFDRFRLLDRESWTDWHSMMSQTIHVIDRSVQKKRFDATPDAEEAASVAQEKQTALMQDIENVRAVLRGCIATTLEWIDRYNRIAFASEKVA